MTPGETVQGSSTNEEVGFLGEGSGSMLVVKRARARGWKLRGTRGLLLRPRPERTPEDYDPWTLEPRPKGERARTTHMEAKDEDPTPEKMLGTAEILAAARSGDQQAKDQLMRRFEPKLRQFLHRRAPRNKRGVLGTDDLVQEVLARAWKGLGTFEHRGQGSFWGYMRMIAKNHLHELRRSRECVAREELEGSGGGPVGGEGEPVEHMMTQEEQEDYERALEELGPLLCTAVQMRLELELTYQEIAAECEFASPDAARMAIQRAYEKLARRLSRRRRDG